MKFFVVLIKLWRDLLRINYEILFLELNFDKFLCLFCNSINVSVLKFSNQLVESCTYMINYSINVSSKCRIKIKFGGNFIVKPISSNNLSCNFHSLARRHIGFFKFFCQCVKQFIIGSIKIVHIIFPFNICFTLKVLAKGSNSEFNFRLLFFMDFKLTQLKVLRLDYISTFIVNKFIHPSFKFNQFFMFFQCSLWLLNSFVWTFKKLIFHKS